jgi:ribosome biogenesis ATPase
MRIFSYSDQRHIKKRKAKFFLMGIKVGSLDKQFIQHALAYQAQVKVNTKADEYAKWDVDKIIIFAQSKDISLNRKPQWNLRKSCEKALSYLKEKEHEESEDSVNELEEGVAYMDVPNINSMNNSLVDIYSKNQALKVPESKATENASEPVDAGTPIKRKQKTTSKVETKKTKLNNTDSKWPTPTAKLSDLGGVDEVSQELLQLIKMPLQHPEIFRHLGIDPPRGIL